VIELIFILSPAMDLSEMDVKPVCNELRSCVALLFLLSSNVTFLFSNNLSS
jgi:hypothetical protein